MRAQVEVYAGDTSSVLESLTPFAASFQGGVSVAAGDARPGAAQADLIVGSGAGQDDGASKAYRGATKARLWSVDAFSPVFSGGVSVAAASARRRRRSRRRRSARAAGGGAQVKVLDGTTAALVGTFLGATGSDAIDVAAG